MVTLRVTANVVLPERDTTTPATSPSVTVVPAIEKTAAVGAGVIDVSAIDTDAVEPT